MAQVELEIAGRKYVIACRDGEEDHLKSVGAIVDDKAREASEALGSLVESRQLLFAALLLADELKDAQAGIAPAPRPEPRPDPAVADALSRVAEHIESLAERVESRVTNA